MGSSLRLLASLVRGVVILILAGTGLCGCGTCRHREVPPLSDAPCHARECYPSVETPVAEGLAASMNVLAQAPPAGSRPLQVLALSGGVAGAPFTAGTLVGWSESGTRPQFDVVTGISSGSLIGAYAFLGSKHDAELQHLILTLNTSDLIQFRPLRCMLCDGAFGSAKPAERLIQRVFNDCFVAELRQAHAEGRRFFVGTMNLETKRLVIWDVGAIASSGRPDAGDLVRKVLLAAVSWPGAVPPVEFDIEVDGHCYHEQHCDAGSVGMAFVRFGQLPGWPAPGAAVRPGWLAGSNLYVLASRKLYSDPTPVPKRALCRVGPSVAAIFEALTRADIDHLYSFCAVCGMHFHLLALPQDYHGAPPSISHLYPKEPRPLFEMGYERSVSGPLWRLTPPGAEPGEEPIPRDGSSIKSCR
ncbi:MAG TPA: patatin-like phospholipase family protein [Gemmataceae bacterium]|nr:patatin-like phospholipase family protein [Gemmataceae bacterium]